MPADPGDEGRRADIDRERAGFQDHIGINGEFNIASRDDRALGNDNILGLGFGDSELQDAGGRRRFQAEGVVIGGGNVQMIALGKEQPALFACPLRLLSEQGKAIGQKIDQHLFILRRKERAARAVGMVFKPIDQLLFPGGLPWW